MTEKQRAALRERYAEHAGKGTLRELAEAIGATLAQVRGFGEYYGLARAYGSWGRLTKAHKEAVEAGYASRAGSVRDFAASIGAPYRSVEYWAIEKGLTRAGQRGPAPSISNATVRAVCRDYAKYRDRRQLMDLADREGLSYHQVTGIGMEMGLTRRHGGAGR